MAGIKQSMSRRNFFQGLAILPGFGLLRQKKKGRMWVHTDGKREIVGISYGTFREGPNKSPFIPLSEMTATEAKVIIRNINTLLELSDESEFSTVRYVALGPFSTKERSLYNEKKLQWC